MVTTAGPSEWSDFVYVYPTEEYPRGSDVEVATVGLLAHQDKGQFDYAICNPDPDDEFPLSPSGLIPRPLTDAIIEDIGDAIDEWEDAVKWIGADGNNIIRVNNIFEGSGASSCEDTSPQVVRTRNQVIFFNDRDMARACGAVVLGCWFPTREDLVMPQDPGSIIMRTSLEILGLGFDWDDDGSGGCSAFYATMMHESGHAFGFDHSSSRDSVMYGPYDAETHSRHQVCKPSVHDVVAMMANYQSRRWR